MNAPDDALLPCPFCGDHVAIKPWHNHWCIYHNTNDCLLAPVDDQLFDTYEQAFAAWNRRAGQAHAAGLREEVARLKDLLRTCDPESMSWLDARDAALEHDQ